VSDVLIIKIEAEDIFITFNQVDLFRDINLNFFDKNKILDKIISSDDQKPF